MAQRWFYQQVWKKRCAVRRQTRLYLIHIVSDRPCIMVFVSVNHLLCEAARVENESSLMTVLHLIPVLFMDNPLPMTKNISQRTPLPSNGSSLLLSKPLVMRLPWVTRLPWVLRLPWVTRLPLVTRLPWVSRSPWVFAVTLGSDSTFLAAGACSRRSARYGFEGKVHSAVFLLFLQVFLGEGH